MNRSGRFVAGAQCPKCHETDRVKVDLEHGEWYWCVACGFEAQRPVETAAAGDDTTALVRIIDGTPGSAVR